MDKGQTRHDGSTRDATHGNQGNQGNLGPCLQLQMPDEESGDDGKGEIGNDAEDTVHITKDGDDGIVNALALLRSAVPHVRNGVALEKADKEESTSGNNGNAHGGVDDPAKISIVHSCAVLDAGLTRCGVFAH